MLTEISRFIAGFAAGFNAVLLLALAWRFWHAWRETTEWLYADTLAVFLALHLTWVVVFLSFDVPTWLYVVGPLSVIVFVVWDLANLRSIVRLASS